MADEKKSNDPKKDLEDTGSHRLDDTLEKNADELADDLEQNELNSTMMSIDVNQIDTTKAKIPLENFPEVMEKTPTDAEFLDEKLEKKKFFLARFFRQIFQSKKLIDSVDSSSSFVSKLFFFIIMLFLLGAAVYAQYVLFTELIESFSNHHPERYVFLGVVSLQAFLSFFVIWKRGSVGWLFALPFTVLTLIFAQGALFYHTADPLFFSIQGRPISQILTYFYVFSLVSLCLVGFYHVFKNIFLKILFGFLLLFSLLAIGLPDYLGVKLEFGFFGPDFLSIIPFDYLQPLYLCFHFVFPLIFLLFFVSSFISETKRCRAFARSFSLFLVSLLILNFALMQKNRVFHVFNYFFPLHLNMGSIEMKEGGLKIKVSTKNFSAFESSDILPRYHLTLDYKNKQKKYLLQVVDEWGFPVKNLKADDLVVSVGTKPSHLTLIEDKKLSLEKGSYTFSVKAEPEEESVKFLNMKKNYLNSDFINIEFSSTKNFKKILIRNENKIYLEADISESHKISFPLFYFNAGPKDLELLVFNDSGQEMEHRSFSFVVEKNPEVLILSPLEGDSINKHFTILLQLEGQPPDSVTKQAYYINNRLVLEFDHWVHFTELPFEGEEKIEELKVVVETPAQTLSKTIKLSQQESAQNIMITAPGQGEFTEPQTKVSYQLSGSDSKMKDLTVFVNGYRFEDIQMTDQSFLLPVSRWETDKIYLSLKANLEEGQQVSTWVQFNKGMSELQLVFHGKSLNFLNLGKAALILDASASQADSWQYKTKWQAIKEALLAPEIEKKLTILDPSFFLYGNTRSTRFVDCSDAQNISSKPGYNKTQLKKILDGAAPKGVSALLAALQMAYKEKPAFILAFADGSDFCHPSLVPHLQSYFKYSPQTKVSFISVGMIAESGQKELRRVAEMTGGKYFQPRDTEALNKVLFESLAFHSELFFQGEKILKIPLEDKVFQFSPGDYVLKIPFENEVFEIPFKLDHGTKTILEISGQKTGQTQKIQVERSVERI